MERRGVHMTWLTLPGRSTKVQVVLPREHIDRLQSTCFRGGLQRFAGNFFAWDFFGDFIGDLETRRLLLAELSRLVDDPRVNTTHRIELEYSRDIGWDAAMESDDLHTEDYEGARQRRLGSRATALFLRPEAILAPKTNYVTLVLRQKFIGHWQFVIYTIYPGMDVGELVGDKTKEANLVFLSWDNPGER